MRIGDLLRCRLVDADGHDLGKVHDVRLVQDGPVRGTQASLRVDALIVGGPGVAVRLGIVRSGVRGPWAVVAPLRRLEHRARVIRFDAVDTSGVGDRVLRLRDGIDLDRACVPLDDAAVAAG